MQATRWLSARRVARSLISLQAPAAIPPAGASSELAVVAVDLAVPVAGPGREASYATERAFERTERPAAALQTGSDSRRAVDEKLLPGPHRGKGAARRQPGSAAGRVRGADGTIRLRQVHLHESVGLP